MVTASEQLAIICGIKPIEIKGHTIYPDFKEPENFVKLYEMEIYVGFCVHGTISYILQKKGYKCFTIAKFLKSLNSFLLDESNKYKDRIKTKIRRSKWK